MIPKIAFCASTGRTATTFFAKTLNDLPEVRALHEGHDIKQEKKPVLPLINIHNRKAWYDEKYARTIVAKMRSQGIMSEAADGKALCIDIAFYNAPLMQAFSSLYPNSPLLVIFRRCESFVQSATVVNGEDREPAGWPAPQKKLSPREQFISLGRLKPQKGSIDYSTWDNWSGISRNIWLWHTINQSLYRFSQNNVNCTVLYYETLTADSKAFWKQSLSALDLLNNKNLEYCVSTSNKKINIRKHYDVGGFSNWTQHEQHMYTNLALSLEKKIYVR